MFPLHIPKKIINSGNYYKLKKIVFNHSIENLDIILNKYNEKYERLYMSEDIFELTVKIDSNEYLSEVLSDEKFYILSRNNFAKIISNSYEGILNGVKFFYQNIFFNNSMQEYEVLDYPDIEERRVHLDCGRKYFSKKWIMDLISFMFEINLNTLNFHFSDNKGYRIWSNVSPEIVSKDGFLTWDEIEEILNFSEIHGIKIIPSFDTPGHVDHILKIHPEYALNDINGNYSKKALDITSNSALNFVKNLYLEQMEIFKKCEHFHIGGDEFMEFHKEDFVKNFRPILDNFAKLKYGNNHSWKDAFIGYLKDISELVQENGFKPRIWNDGLFYGENKPDIPKQLIQLDKSIGIDYWCIMGWTSNVASLDVILKNGYTNIYNSNSDYLYYVLRESIPDDGRKQNSWNFKKASRKIFDEWSVGKFSGYILEDSDPIIKGTSISIWCDNFDLVDENEIFSDIIDEFIIFSLISYDRNKNKYNNLFSNLKKIKNYIFFSKIG